MPRNFNLNLAGLKWKDPQVAMRAVLGVLLLANLVAAVIAFKPFGGSADDLRRERNSLQQQLAQLQKTVADTRKQVEKVKIARAEGDEFLAKYFADRRVVTSTIQGELVDIAKQAGVIYQPTTWTPEPIEGSDTLAMMTINAGCQGTYAALSKFVNLVDRSPRFLILESMVAAPQQAGQTLNVTVKIDTFIKEASAGSGEMGGPAAPVAMPEAGPGGGL
ncbi:MAG: Fimbrial assembly family protein [Candidatus Solibacter sp.]|jgi:Tfp pilus assembly protein PilO|nr:Fimbrial assembly family protein [Candidatus Solibacter sp.]